MACFDVSWYEPLYGLVSHGRTRAWFGVSGPNHGLVWCLRLIESHGMNHGMVRCIRKAWFGISGSEPWNGLVSLSGSEPLHGLVSEHGLVSQGANHGMLWCLSF